MQAFIFNAAVLCEDCGVKAGAALSCECYATVEEAQVESRRLELCPGDVLELIDCNPE